MERLPKWQKLSAHDQPALGSSSSDRCCWNVRYFFSEARFWIISKRLTKHEVESLDAGVEEFDLKGPVFDLRT